MGEIERSEEIKSGRKRRKGGRREDDGRVKLLRKGGSRSSPILLIQEASPSRRNIDALEYFTTGDDSKKICKEGLKRNQISQCKLRNPSQSLLQSLI